MIWISLLSIVAMLAGWLGLRRIVRMRYCRMRGLAATGAAAAVFAGALMLFLAWTGWLFPGQMNESGYRRLLRAQSLKLGQAIAAKAPNLPVTLVCAADVADGDRIAYVREVLEQELKLRVKVLPVTLRRQPRRVDEDAGVPLARQLASRDYDEALAGLDGGEVLLFAENLPEDYSRMRLWKQRNRPPVYLMDTEVPGRFLAAIDCGWITAMTTNNPGADYNDVAVPYSPEAAFEMRYLWIDAGNCRQMW